MTGPAQIEDAIALAKRLGTYRKDDRSAQYPPAKERYSPELLLKNDNLHFYNDRRLKRMQLRYAVGLLLLARAPEIWACLARLF